MPVPANAPELKSAIGQQVLVGIRPEQITQSGGGNVGNDVHDINCQIDLTEPTGPDTLVYMQVNDTKVVGRVHPSADPVAGDQIALAFDLSKAVFFDQDSGARIR